MHPVRSEMFIDVAACSTKESGSISPFGWDGRNGSVQVRCLSLETRTARKIRDMTEPVSACSPMDLMVRVGMRDSTRDTGVSVLSCRNSASECAK